MSAFRCRCDEHYDHRKREEGRRWYFTKRWQQLRSAVLDDWPLCVSCESAGVVRPATDVDHIIDHRGNEHLFFDRDNLQPLCKRCHSRKTNGAA